MERWQTPLGPGIESLVRAAQSGDARAFEALARLFRAPLASYAYALLRDEGLAEDAAQEALLQAWRGLAALRDPPAFRGWLYAIVENVALSGWRWRRRRDAVPLREHEAVAEGTPGLGGEAGIEAAAMRESLDALPERFREVLLQRYVVGLSNHDVAAAVGLTENGAKVRLHRARIALRRELLARGVTAAAPARAVAP